MRDKINNYQDALRFFSQLEFFGIKLGLEQMRRLAKIAGSPQDSLRFVHVAGTNGKGTVSAMMAEALRGAGLNAGLYTSPHLVSPRERFKINGRAISKEEFAVFTENVRKILLKAAQEGFQPTYFEAATLLALIYFKEHKTDIVVWECGLGGRLDATNIVRPEISIITSIGKDHCEQLGKTFAKIASEKAGIIKHDIPCFCGKNISQSARTAIMDYARLYGAPIYFADSEAEIIYDGCFSRGKFIPQKLKYDGKIIELSFPGTHQRKNIPLVCESIRYLSNKLGFLFDLALSAVKYASLPARMSIMPDGTIIDGAHNPQAVETAVKNIIHYFGKEKFMVIFGGLKDKDVALNLRRLTQISKGFAFVTVKGSRKSYSGFELLSIFNSSRQIDAMSSNLEDALRGKCAPKLVIGSFYLAGEALKKYFNEEEIINWRLK